MVTVSPITYVGESIEMVESAADALGGYEIIIPKITEIARMVNTSLCTILLIINNA